MTRLLSIFDFLNVMFECRICRWRMAESQNPAIPAALRRIMAEKPAISADIYHCGKPKPPCIATIAALVPLFDNPEIYQSHKLKDIVHWNLSEASSMQVLNESRNKIS